MQQSTDLQNMLHSIHRKSYPAYKSLKGAYQFGHYILSVDHVQGDPFASPSHISIRVSHKTAGFPEEYLQNPVTKITLCDYLTRQFEQQINRFSFRAKGSGKSGLISVSHCGQEVLKRTACEITDESPPVSLSAFLPTDALLIPLSWKRSCLIFCQSVYKKPFFIKIWMQKNWKKPSFSQKIRPISGNS